jgi:hypothetical protein
MAAPVGFSRWIGSFFLRYKPLPERGLTRPKVREECGQVIVAIRRQLFAGSVDFRHNRVFPHDAMFP